MLTSAIVIRDADVNDLAALTGLMTDLGYPATLEEFTGRFKHIAVHPDYKTIVALAGDELVGMAGLSKNIYYEANGMYLRILAFVVKQNCRELGIGRLLIEASEQWALEQGLTTVFINSGNRAERDAAHAFYKKMGYAIKSSGFVKKL